MSRILLLLENKKNRDLLAEWLEMHYEVVLPDGVQGLDTLFDLCLVDGPTLDRVWKQVQARIIHAFNIEVRLRIKEDKPFVTDHGHYILDCFFQQIHDPVALNRTLKNIPGLVEDGLFLNMASMALIGMQDGTIQTLKRNK